VSGPDRRQQYEQSQAAWLARCAVREADCGPRAHDEPPHPYRTCFQRDRDRVIHCSAFRRLDFKTQVFVPHEHDHYRTRMTHTIEVAQIGRTIARALRLNEDLVETVALAHDLGHPPFGHAGEAVLNELMADDGHFEHNRQSLRVVDYLEHPYPAFRGLNLTLAVRECLAKHRTRYDTPISQEFDLSQQAPLEGQLVDAADEIAYTSADLEDALHAGWVTVEQVAELPLWRQAWEAAGIEHAGARPVHQRIRAVKGVLSAMADDLAQTTAASVERMRLESPDDARRGPARAVSFSPAMASAAGRLGEFLMQNVYLHADNRRQEAASRKIITGLFEAYLRQPSLLPGRYAQRIEADGLKRTICDFIAGMTNRYASQEHARLTGEPTSA
jgi:dGTPase